MNKYSTETPKVNKKEEKREHPHDYRWHNVHIPAPMSELLLKHPYFQKNPKKMQYAVRTLNKMLFIIDNQDSKSNKNNKYDKIPDGYASFGYRFFTNRIGDHYAECRDALISLQIINCDWSWREQYLHGLDDTGKCYYYTITQIGLDALANENKRNLFNLLHDKTEKRKNQKRISKRKHNHKQYNDIRDEIKATNDNIMFDYHEVTSLLDVFPAKKRAMSYHLLVDIVKKDYSDLNVNDSDGRIYNPYTQLPHELKPLLKINNVKYNSTIDIRGCHVSLFSELIMAMVEENIQHTLTHIDSGKLDISLLQDEHKAYNKFFLSEVDGRDKLAIELGISKTDLKNIINAYINGQGFTKNKTFIGKRGLAYHNWFKSNFPEHYKAWMMTKLEDTGCNISKLFETKVILHPDIYNKANQLGIYVGYENDGFSIFSNYEDNVPEFLSFVESLSYQLLGIQLVFKRETLISEMLNGRIQLLQHEVVVNKKKLKQMHSKCYISKKWDNYRALKTLNDSLEKQIEQLTKEENDHMYSHEVQPQSVSQPTEQKQSKIEQDLYEFEKWGYEQGFSKEAPTAPAEATTYTSQVAEPPIGTEPLKITIASQHAEELLKSVKSANITKLDIMRHLYDKYDKRVNVKCN